MTYNTDLKDKNYIFTNCHTYRSSLDFDKLDVSLIANIREYIYKNMKQLIKYSFLADKQTLEA